MKRFGFAVRLLALVVVLIAATAVLTGCGDDKKSGGNAADGKSFSKDEPVGDAKKVVVDSEKGFNKEEQAVIDKIAEFADATQGKDYKKICQDLLTKAASKIGGDCEGTFKRSGDLIRDFKITVRSVKVAAGGKTASADATATTNIAKEGTAQTIALAKDSKGEWRIAILGQ
ncbi:MAG TPA: hypothetical protein VGO97_06170 [Solirubrobacterales bacterium]|jgi:hypothetical protein|nr:hypothetical protein [Solirubrobacterales bacterium]